MQRTILLFIVLTAALGSFAANDGYKVSGKVAGAHDGDTVKLSSFEGFSETVHATALVKNGTFTFTGRQDVPVMRYISCARAGKSLGSAQFILENGNIEVNLDSATFKFDIKGTADNETWCKFQNEEDSRCGKSLELYRALQDSTLSAVDREAKTKELETVDARLTAFRLDFCKQNITNPAGVYVLLSNGRDFVEAERDALAAQVPDDMATPEIIALRQKIENKRKTALNQPFTDFAMATPEGGTLRVSDVAKTAKVLMIDFWASWCGPCRTEMPNVKAAYEKYHSKGFEIIGVSLDNDKEAWLKSIGTLGLKWPQVSDLKGWKCEGAELYGVKAIPATVIIKDGKIVARNVRGEEMEKTLSELLK